MLWKQKLLEPYPWLRNQKAFIDPSRDPFQIFVSLNQRDKRWERGTPRKTHVISAGSDKVLALRLTPAPDPTSNGGYLISAGYDRRVRFFHYINEEWKEWHPSVDVEMTMSCVDMDVNTMTMACGGFVGVCKIYRHGKLFWNLQSHASPITCLAMNASVVVTGGADHIVCVWNIETGTRISVFGMRNIVEDCRYVWE